MDQLQVRYEVMPTATLIFGVGVDRDLNRHLGLRADLRAFGNLNELRTRIDTSPVSVSPSTPAVTFRSLVNPDLQVSTNPQITSLSLYGVDHFESFLARGALPSFSAGVFFRF